MVGGGCADVDNAPAVFVAAGAAPAVSDARNTTVASVSFASAASVFAVVVGVL